MSFAVGQTVYWVSSNTRKLGEILAIVPAGSIPRDVGYPIDGAGSPRFDGVSYVVRGRKLDQHGKEWGLKATYWPRTSLLKDATEVVPRNGKLTIEEIAWCHDNAALVRSLMAKHKGPSAAD